MQPVPDYMDKGSRGPHVSLLGAFLCGYGNTPGGILFDQDYGGVTAAAVDQFQADNELDRDGNFGPQTRARANKLFEFDFAAACASVPGTTVFKHGDEEIEWTSPAGLEDEATPEAAAPQEDSCRCVCGCGHSH